TTGLAYVLVHREVDLALVRLLEPPSAISIAFLLDDRDRFVDAIVGLRAGRTKVVQRPQDVVVPTGRKRELRIPRVDHLARRQPAQQPTLEEVLLATLACRSHCRRTSGHALVLEQ